jgi:hypothetical protein
MGSRKQQAMSPYPNSGEPRPADVAITVITALILLVVLVVVAVL